jgi:hypothetical protein
VALEPGPVVACGGGHEQHVSTVQEADLAEEVPCARRGSAFGAPTAIAIATSLWPDATVRCGPAGIVVSP